MIPLVTRQSQLQRGLVARFKMDDNAANTNVADSSRKGLTATSVRNTSLMSAADRAAVPNHAFQFDGSGDYVNQQRITEIDSSDYISVGLWFKCASFASTARCVWAWNFFTDGGNQSAVRILALANDHATRPNRMYAHCYWPSAYQIQWSTTAQVLDNAWHHFLMVGGTAYNAFYIDGASDAGNYDVGNSASRCHLAGATQPYVGTRFGASQGPDGYFPGLLDDLRIWNRRLNLVDAQRLAGLR